MAPPHGPALTGVFNAPGSDGPFRPRVGDGRVVSIELSGVWVGTIKLLRSTDGGATKHPLKIGGIAWGEFTISGVEQVWEETDPRAEFYVDANVTSGSVNYRVFN